jgi:hypothetical protein
MRRYRTKPAKTSNPKKPKIQSKRKAKNQIQSYSNVNPNPKENPILSKRKANPNPILSKKTTGIQHYETVKHNILPENIALLLRGIFFELLSYDRDCAISINP